MGFNIKYHDLKLGAPSMRELNFFFSIRRSTPSYHYLVVNKKHNKKGFFEGRVRHERDWKEPFFYLYDVERVQVCFNAEPSKQLTRSHLRARPSVPFFPTFSSFILQTYFFFSLAKRNQIELYGKLKKRTYRDRVLSHAGKHFNLKTLITEENLKRVGALS